MASSSTNSPCAACKFLRRKCTPGCVFSPYFPPDQPAKFANVHRVFGASNVAKLLNELSSAQREDAVNSLAYEAEARLRDPVYGCVGYISILQHRLKQLQQDLDDAKKELSSYIGPSALPGPFLAATDGAASQISIPLMNSAHAFHQQQHSAAGQPVSLVATPPSLGVVPYSLHPHAAATPVGLMGASPSTMLAQPQQILEAQRLAAAVAAAREHQEMLMRDHSYHQQQHDHLSRYGTSMEGASSGTAAVSGGFNYLSGVVSLASQPPSGRGLTTITFDNPFHNAPHHSHLQEQQQQQQEQRRQQPTRPQEQRSVPGDNVRGGSSADGACGRSSSRN